MSVGLGLLAVVLVPLLDQLLKAFIRRSLGSRSIQLAGAGELRLVQSRLWIQRVAPVSPPMVWAAWIVAAAAIAAASLWSSNLIWAAGLMLGGSLSHAWETTVHGSVSDYVCLRFWPAFDLADVALTIGALGWLVGVWPVVARIVGP